MMIVATFFLGPLFFVVGFSLIAVFLLLPYLMMRNRKLKTIDQHLAEKAEKAREAEKSPEAGKEGAAECRGSGPEEPQETGEPVPGNG